MVINRACRWCGCASSAPARAATRYVGPATRCGRESRAGSAWWEPNWWAAGASVWPGATGTPPGSTRGRCCAVCAPVRTAMTNDPWCHPTVTVVFRTEGGGRSGHAQQRQTAASDGRRDQGVGDRADGCRGLAVGLADHDRLAGVAPFAQRGHQRHLAQQRDLELL